MLCVFEVGGLPEMLDGDVPYLFRSWTALEAELYDLKTEKEEAKIILQRFPCDLSDHSGRQ